MRSNAASTKHNWTRGRLHPVEAITQCQILSLTPIALDYLAIGR